MKLFKFRVFTGGPAGWTIVQGLNEARKAPGCSRYFSNASLAWEEGEYVRVDVQAENLGRAAMIITELSSRAERLWLDWMEVK